MPGPTDTTRSDALWVLGFALALLALAGWMAWESYPAFASRFWPTTQGVVRSVKLWEKRQLSSGKLNSYALDITYEYTVNGAQYAGWRLNSRSNHFPEEALNTVRQQYQPRAACTVHYSPLFPSQSVLDTGVTWHSWVKLALGAALAGATWCLLLALRKPKEAAPARAPGRATRRAPANGIGGHRKLRFAEQGAAADVRRNLGFRVFAAPCGGGRC